MNIADVTIYLKLGGEEEKEIVQIYSRYQKNRNVIDIVYLKEYYKYRKKYREHL